MLTQTQIDADNSVTAEPKTDYTTILAVGKVNKEIITDLYRRREKDNLDLDTKRKSVSSKYWDLEIDLRDKKNAELNVIDCERVTLNRDYEAEIVQYSNIIYKIKRIFLFKKIQKEIRVLEHPIYNSRQGRDCLLIDHLHDSNNLVLDAYLVGNDKPKNKYSLIIIGNNRFREVSKERRDYGSPGYVTGNCDIEFGVRDFPSKVDLQIWYGKNIAALLKPIINELKQNEAEMYEVVTNCNTVEWDLAYWNDKKEHYEDYRRIDTAEYAEILQVIAQLESMKGGSHV
jgi:hypothetical protein